MNGAPLLSVVITAWRPRPYLRDALNSVRVQSDSMNPFETILVVNPLSPANEPGLPLDGVRIIECTESGVGAFIAAGVEASRGEIIAFLDDDDFWLPGRLRRVTQIMANCDRVGYYHNQQIAVDSSSTLTSFPFFRTWRFWRTQSSPIELGKDASVRLLSRVGRFLPYFNNSSIAVRRSILLSHIDGLKRLRRNEDEFVFYAALASRHAVFLDSARLTAYRVHGQNISTGVGGLDEPRLRKAYEFTSQSIEAQSIIRDLICGCGREDLMPLVSRELAFASVLNAVQSDDYDRKRIARRCLSLAKHIQVFDAGANSVALGVATASLLFPSAIQQLYARVRT